MNERNKIYTATDFARYHAGTMPAGEMHALEKDALEDPFLTDALEGYLNTQNAETDIAELGTRVSERTKPKQTFFGFRKGNNIFIRVAAMLILFAGVGYFFYKINDHKQELPLAKNKTKETVQKITADTAVIPADTTAVLQTIKPTNKIIDTNPVQNKDIVHAAPVYENDQQRKAVLSPVAEAKTPQSAEAMVLTKKDEAKYRNSQNDYYFRGNLNNEKGFPIPGAIVRQSNSQTARTDSDGRFSFHAPDSVVSAIVFADGYDSKNIKLKNQAEPVITMQEKNEALRDEVVVTTASGIKKQTKELGYSTTALNGKISGIAINSEELKSFNEYVNKNILPQQNEKDITYKGKVVLSFKVNKRGKPVNIKTETSLCESCDEEAVRLLKNGPKWPPIKNERRRVVIEFK